VRTEEQFQTEIASLSKCRRIAFACACAEHVLPLFEKEHPLLCAHQSLAPADNVRAALDMAWRLALGERVTSAELEDADQLACRSIPRIDLDNGVEAELAMNSAVTVLETLDLIKNDCLTTVGRASASALNTVMIACYIKHPNLDDSANPFPKLHAAQLVGSEWEPLVSEWALQNTQLDDLLHLKGQNVTNDWKAHHTMQGVLLRKKLG
jgi:hypothetical protein